MSIGVTRDRFRVITCELIHATSTTIVLCSHTPKIPNNLSVALVVRTLRRRRSERARVYFQTHTHANNIINILPPCAQVCVMMICLRTHVCCSILIKERGRSVCVGAFRVHDGHADTHPHRTLSAARANSARTCRDLFERWKVSAAMVQHTASCVERCLHMHTINIYILLL